MGHLYHGYVIVITRGYKYIYIYIKMCYINLSPFIQFNPPKLETWLYNTTGFTTVFQLLQCVKVDHGRGMG